MMRNPDLTAIKLVGFDVDGVLTDGRIILHGDGLDSKNFNCKDGLGVKLLTRAGIEAVIITARKSVVVETRAREMGVSELHQLVDDKWAVFQDILARRGLSPREAAFAGDDLIDLPIMTRVGLAMAPTDAAPEVLSRAHFVAPARGGHGAARQMAEYLLKGRGLWDGLVDSYLAHD
jgi:3-deoxy-D-manno-octulosonate 8-phosphate phosphatase (KDO 8-P phosphatase)